MQTNDIQSTGSPPSMSSLSSPSRAAVGGAGVGRWSSLGGAPPCGA